MRKEDNVFGKESTRGHISVYETKTKRQQKT